MSLGPDHERPAAVPAGRAVDQVVGGGHDEDLRDRSIGELLKQLSSETSTLVRQEMALAKAELTQQGKQAGKGAGLFGGAALLGLGAFGAFTAFLIALLATALNHTWLAALIVAIVYAAIAGLVTWIVTHIRRGSGGNRSGGNRSGGNRISS